MFNDGPDIDDRRSPTRRSITEPDRRRRLVSGLVWHLGMLVLLLGAVFVTQVFAQAPTPAPGQVESLLDRWLSPNAVLTIALVILYAGELRGDVRRLKEDVAQLRLRLHDDYMPRETIEARFDGMGRRADDR